MTDDPRSDSARSISSTRATSSARSTGSTRSTAGDPELIIAARAGDGAAFVVLRQRHQVAALRLATLLTESDDAAAVVTQRAFDRARRNLESGGGPDTAFRLQILRDVAAAAAGPAEDDSTSADLPADEASTSPRAEADPVVRRSFLSLPERWGTVLWHTDVEQESDAQVALLLGMRAGTVTALAARSREGLVRGYLAGQVHQLDDPTCTKVLDGLPRSTRDLPGVGADAVSQDPTVQAHLDGCAGCSAAARRVSILTHDLGAALAVVVLGEHGIPYLEVAETAGRRTGTPAARVPTRARSMRLVLVAVALVAVTAAVPALRAGAGSSGPENALTAAVLAPPVDPVATSAPADAPGSAAGATATTGGSAGPAAATTTPANPSEGRATITTTGANGRPTRLAVTTTTRMGVDGVPTTLAVIPGVAGSPDTTVTGSITSADGPPPGFPDFSTYGPGTTNAPGTRTTGAGSTPAPTGAVPTTGTGRPQPSIYGVIPAAPTTAAPAPGTKPPASTPRATPTPVTQAPVTTPTAGNPPPPSGGSDPSTGSVESSIDPSTDPTDPASDAASEEPSSVSPPAPAPDIQIQVPENWLIPVLRTTPSQALFLISNQTGVAIAEQQLTVTLPADIDVTASGSAGGCERQNDTTFMCTVDALSESDGLHSVALWLTAGADSEGGTITISVTGHQASGTVAPAL